MKKRTKLMIIIPACLLLLFAIAIGIMHVAIGRGGVLSILSTVRFRTHMMQAAQYEDPGGLTLPYRIYVPENMDESERYPVVLFLQGGGHRGTDNRQQTDAFGVMHVLLSRKNREKYPCILVAPQSPPVGDWADDELTPVLMGMLEQVAANYPTDPNRVYVTGLSLGGSGAWAMLAAYPDYFAAGVPICGWWIVEDAPLLKDIPVWIFHGEKDYPNNARAMAKALKDAGSTQVKYTEYPNEGHWSWGRAYYEPELFPWLFAQEKSQAQPVDPLDMMAGDVYETLPYRIYAPYIPDGDARLPLVLCLHGSGNNGDDNLAQLGSSSAVHTLLAPENLAKYPCVVVAPQCPVGQRWVRGYGQYDLPGNTDVLMGLLEYIKIAYNTDPDRVYITGLSMGGFGTWGMLRAYPDYFAAAVPICGGWDLPDDLENAPRMKDTPIWVFHGTLDDDVPVERSREMVQALEAAGGNVRFTEYPNEGHWSWGRAYYEPELFPWLFAQTRSDT